MEKLIYLLHGKGLDAAARGDLAAQLRQQGARQLVWNAREPGQWDTVQQKSPQRIAGDWGSLDSMLEFWLDCVDTRQPLERVLSKAGYRLDGYLVTESLVQAPSPQPPAQGQRPGVTQFTAHAKPAAVSEEAFYRNWCAHSELSFALHPRRWSYVRNAVARPLTEAAPAYRSIVLEHFHSVEDFTDDGRYFGSAEVVEEMYRDLAGFCDVERMITGPLAEERFGA